MESAWPDFASRKAAVEWLFEFPTLAVVAAALLLMKTTTTFWKFVFVP